MNKASNRFDISTAGYDQRRCIGACYRAQSRFFTVDFARFSLPLLPLTIPLAYRRTLSLRRAIADLTIPFSR